MNLLLIYYRISSKWELNDKVNEYKNIQEIKVNFKQQQKVRE